MMREQELNHNEEQPKLLEQVKAKADWITSTLALVQKFVNKFDDKQELETALQELKVMEMEVLLMIPDDNELENANLDEVVLKVNSTVESIYASKVVKMMMLNMLEYEDNSKVFDNQEEDELMPNIYKLINPFTERLVEEVERNVQLKSLILCVF